MTHEKAREFFSAYLEGTLDPAVRATFEHRLEGDEALREEYTRFEAVVGQLSMLKDEQIEVPIGLTEQITARLDRHLWEQKQSAPSSIFSRLRLIGFSGIAAAALIGAVISLRHRGGPEMSSLVPIESDHLSVSMKRDVLSLDFAPASKATVVLRSEPGDKPFAQVVADKTNPLSRPVMNHNPETELISIQVLDAPESEQLIVALPGSRPEKTKAGSGTIEDLARVLAAHYRVPVTLAGVDPVAQVSWDLTAPDARQAAEAALKGEHCSVDQRDGNLITISRG